MIRRSASPTSASRASCWSGSPRSSCARACSAPSNRPAQKRSSAPASEAFHAGKVRYFWEAPSFSALGMPPTTTEERSPSSAEPAYAQALPGTPAHGRDLRSKKPPALSFLLRMETLRRIARVVSLLAIDVAGVVLAIYTALALKASVRGDYIA